MCSFYYSYSRELPKRSKSNSVSLPRPSIAAPTKPPSTGHDTFQNAVKSTGGKPLRNHYQAPQDIILYGVHTFTSCQLPAELCSGSRSSKPSQAEFAGGCWPTRYCAGATVGSWMFDCSAASTTVARLGKSKAPAHHPCMVVVGGGSHLCGPRVRLLEAAPLDLCVQLLAFRVDAGRRSVEESGGASSGSEF